MKRSRIRQPNRSQQTRCKTFNNCARGSDPWQGWNAAECKRALEVLLAGVSAKRTAEQPMHLNRSKTQTNHRNTLRDFSLYVFSKHRHWFRFSGKGKHLNLAQTHNSEANQLTANTLQDFWQLCPRFRSLAELECRGIQMLPRGVSGRGIHQTRNRTAQASELEQNSKNLPQHIERLFVVRFQQAPFLVQIQR